MIQSFKFYNFILNEKGEFVEFDSKEKNQCY